MQEVSSAPRVLVVEDEYFIAREVSEALAKAGTKVIGPVPDQASALKAFDENQIDFVILDLNLDGRADFSLADEITRRGVPFIFATGYDARMIPERFSSVKRFEKPYDAGAIIAFIEGSKP